MAKTAIARYDVATHWLPAICPKHGLPADRRVTRRYSSELPMWMNVVLGVSFLLFLYAFGVFLIVAAICALIHLSTRTTDEVTLPACGSCDRRRRLVLHIRIGSGVSALVLLVAAAGLSSGGLMVLAVVVAIVWLFLMTSLLHPVHMATGYIDQQWLWLRNVHPEFARSLRPNPAWQSPQWTPPAHGAYQPQYAAPPTGRTPPAQPGR